MCSHFLQSFCCDFQNSCKVNLFLLLVAPFPLNRLFVCDLLVQWEGSFAILFSNRPSIWTRGRSCWLHSAVALSLLFCVWGLWRWLLCWNLFLYQVAMSYLKNIYQWATYCTYCRIYQRFIGDRSWRLPIARLKNDLIARYRCLVRGEMRRRGVLRGITDPHLATAFWSKIDLIQKYFISIGRRNQFEFYLFCYSSIYNSVCGSL